jgi:hypothetical protein
MHTRRIACLLLGMWLAGGFMVFWITSRNAGSADHLLSDDPAVIVMVRSLGSSTGRALLRHQGSELNRELTEDWETAQLFIAIFFFAFLLLGTRERKSSLALAFFMLLLLLPQRFYLTPQLAALTRPMDFAPDGTAAAGNARLNMLNLIYTGTELMKWTAGLVLASILIFQKTRRSYPSGYPGKELNLVDKPNHRHVDR